MRLHHKVVEVGEEAKHHQLEHLHRRLAHLDRDILDHG